MTCDRKQNDCMLLPLNCMGFHGVDYDENLYSFPPVVI